MLSSGSTKQFKRLLDTMMSKRVPRWFVARAAPSTAWHATPAGKRWREITQERDVPPQKVGREPIFPWEAKVYALV